MALSVGLKAKFSLYSALIFFLVANPATYRVTNQLIGGLADASGCPTSLGLLVHTVVFFLVSFAIMFFPRDPY